MAAHRYWRLAITANHAAANGSGIVSAEEIEFRASAGGADLTGSGTAIGSGTPANAFDNNTSTIWFNENGHNGPELFEFGQPNHVSFVGYDFGAGSPVDVREIYYESQVGQPGREPRHMLVQFSDDNATWITAETFWNIPAWSNGEARTFTVPEWTAFPTYARRYWRIQLIDTFDSTYGALSRIDFLDKASGSWLSFNGTASAGNTAGGSAAGAFDGYPGNYWTGNKDTWVQYAFSAGVKWDFVGVRLRGLNGFASRSPKSFIIQDSDDGTAWRDRLTVTNEPSWSDGDFRTYDIPSVSYPLRVGAVQSSVAGATTQTQSLAGLGHQAGDILIFIASRSNTGSGGVPTSVTAGWNRLTGTNAPQIGGVFYKISDGTETQVQVTYPDVGNLEALRVECWRHPDGLTLTHEYQHWMANANQQPFPHTARGGVDNVFLVIRYATVGHTSISAGPSGYTGYAEAGDPDYTCIATAYRESASDFEDPGAWNNSTAAGAMYMTIGLSPNTASTLNSPYRVSARNWAKSAHGSPNSDVIPLTHMGIVAGDLLLLSTCGIGSFNLSSTPAGWTVLNNTVHTTNLRNILLTRRADGAETSVTLSFTGTFNNTSRVEVWRDAADPTFTKQEFSSQANNNPPSHDAGSVAKRAWLAIWQGAQQNPPTAPPSGYVSMAKNGASSTYNQWWHDSGGSGFSNAIAYRIVEDSQTEDPGAWTNVSTTRVTVFTLTFGYESPATELEIAASLPALAASVSLDAGIPAPEAVTVNHPSQTQNVPFNVNWTAVTGADSYEVKYSKGGAAQVMLSAAAVGTSVVFSPTQTGTFVFYVRTNIDGEYSEQTASVTVTVAKQGKATFGKITILTAGTGNLSGEVTPDGTVRGVVVGIVQSLTPGGSVDEVSGVTYGGVAMQEITALAHDHSEDGRIYLYFLGSGIPAGAQTVEVTASGTTAEKVAFIFTVHAGADTELHAFDTLSSGSVANPSDTLLLNGRTSFVGLFGFAGRDAVVNTAPLAGWTDSAEADQGSSVALAYRYLTVDGVDVTYGWTQAADDAAAIAFAVSAVGSAASAGGTGTGRIDGIDVIDQIGRI